MKEKIQPKFESSNESSQLLKENNSQDILNTDSYKAEAFDSQRGLCENILDQNLPTLRATKSGKKKKDRIVSNLFAPHKVIKNHPSGTSYPACLCDKRKEILVVDDNIFNILTLQTILE